MNRRTPATTDAPDERCCEHCGTPLPPERSARAVFCDGRCRAASSRRRRERGEPPRRHRAALAPSRVRVAWWDEQLEAIGEPPRTAAGRPALTLERAERLLAETGADLATATGDDIAALLEHWPASRASRVRLRRSLSLAALVLGRPDLPADAVELPDDDAGRRRPSPLERTDVEAFERAAWRLGGAAGLAGLLAVHTPLSARQLAALRWEQVAAVGAATVVRGPARSYRLAERVADALTARGRTVGYLFPSGEGHATSHELVGHLRRVAAHAGMPDLAPARLEVTAAGEVNADLLEPLEALEATWAPASTLGGCGLSVEQLLATGIAARTAHSYLRFADRAADALAARGTDLAGCGPVDLVAVAETFPASRSSRQMLRSALARAWEALGRDDPPPLKAIRLPPRPRRRAKALDADQAERLNAAAWDRRDEPAGLAILIGMHSGMRRAEIASLRWEHIDLDSATPEFWVHGKGDLEAPVPVHPRLVDALRQRRQASGWVFPARAGRSGHVNPTTVWTWSKRIAETAGLDPAAVRTHLLRHTFLTEANDRSGDLRAVQEIARHARPETTAGYTRVNRQRMQEVTAMVRYGHTPAAEADPAQTIPACPYRQLVEAFEADDAPAWVDLGVALTAAGWRYEIHGGQGPFLWWVHPDDERLVAFADVDHRDETRSYELRRLDGDEEDAWSFPQPADLAAAAAALAAGVDVAGSRRYGPWIEQPFVEFLRGDPPDRLPPSGPAPTLHALS